MGQKTHPYGFRLGAVKPWKSRWFAQGKDFPKLLAEDEKLRQYLHARLSHAAISSVEIERKPTKIVVTIHTGRPGVVIGKRGAEVDKLRDELALLTDSEVSVNVEEIKRPETDAQLVADNWSSSAKNPRMVIVIGGGWVTHLCPPRRANTGTSRRSHSGPAGSTCARGPHP